MGFDMELDGTLTLTGQGGTGNVLLPNPSVVFGMGVSIAALAAMNLQSPWSRELETRAAPYAAMHTGAVRTSSGK